MGIGLFFSYLYTYIYPYNFKCIGKMIGLPAEFACFGDASKGGGVIQVKLYLVLFFKSYFIFLFL